MSVHHQTVSWKYRWREINQLSVTTAHFKVLFLIVPIVLVRIIYDAFSSTQQ